MSKYQRLLCQCCRNYKFAFTVVLLWLAVAFQAEAINFEKMRDFLSSQETQDELIGTWIGQVTVKPIDFKILMESSPIFVERVPPKERDRLIKSQVVRGLDSIQTLKSILEKTLALGVSCLEDMYMQMQYGPFRPVRALMFEDYENWLGQQASAPPTVAGQGGYLPPPVYTDEVKYSDPSADVFPPSPQGNAGYQETPAYNPVHQGDAGYNPAYQGNAGYQEKP
ncbi:hypothetical protein, partial [Sansalvadorimonas verongulae]|uniref:hypothetical protein n=1 Tax=Sansalvadorimonas verongulae TaxID=2172824 RepID=UPI001E56EE3D